MKETAAEEVSGALAPGWTRDVRLDGVKAFRTVG
jgi:hypothetical protein